MISPNFHFSESCLPENVFPVFGSLRQSDLDSSNNERRPGSITRSPDAGGKLSVRCQPEKPNCNNKKIKPTKRKSCTTRCFPKNLFLKFAQHLAPRSAQTRPELAGCLLAYLLAVSSESELCTHTECFPADSPNEGDDDDAMTKEFPIFRNRTQPNLTNRSTERV